MTQNYDLTGNTLIADGFNLGTPIADADQAAITQTYATTGTYATDDDALQADITALFTLASAIRAALVEAQIIKGAA